MTIHYKIDPETKLINDLKEDLQLYNNNWEKFVQEDGLHITRRYYRFTVIQLITMGQLDIPTTYPDKVKIDLEGDDLTDEAKDQFKVQDLTNQIIDMVMI